MAGARLCPYFKGCPYFTGCPFFTMLNFTGFAVLKMEVTTYHTLTDGAHIWWPHHAFSKGCSVESTAGSTLASLQEIHTGFQLNILCWTKKKKGQNKQMFLSSPSRTKDTTIDWVCSVSSRTIEISQYYLTLGKCWEINLALIFLCVVFMFWVCRQKNVHAFV